KAFELEAIPTSVLSFIPCFVVSEASPWPFEYTTFPSFIIPTDIPGTSKVFRVFCTNSSSCFSLICANVKKEKRANRREIRSFIKIKFLKDNQFPNFGKMRKPCSAKKTVLRQNRPC